MSETTGSTQTASSTTQTHRAQQLLLSAATIAAIGKLFPLLDWRRLDLSFPGFAQAVGQVVIANRRTSAGLAAAYLRARRREVTGLPDIPPVLAQPLDVEQFVTSLRVASVVTAKKAAARGEPEEVAMPSALTLVEGTGSRLVLDAARETIAATSASDPQSVGWRRVLGKNGGCDFCAMLASRGAVYSESTVDFAAHNHCQCTAEPAYSGEIGEVRPVQEYVPSAKGSTPASRAAVRRWIAANPRSN